MQTLIEPWLSVDEIAAYLKVSKETVYRWLERGKIPAHRVGKQWRFQTEEVNVWIRRGEAADGSAIKQQKPKQGRDNG